MSQSKNEQTKNEDIELNLLIEAIYLKYGYDFRNYSWSHVKRRVFSRLSREGLHKISDATYRIIYDREFFRLVLSDLSINVTAMFRDPSFYKSFRENVVPILRTYPFIKIWHAGCSTGEEVYSMAILLKEEGLYDRTRIYATDFNEVVLEKARDAIYPIQKIKEYTLNYQQSGGSGCFSDYYLAEYDSVIMDHSLKKNIVFADHNLVTDGVFGEMQVILCRNVLIYFNRELQDKVIQLFLDSLSKGCFLCLGSKESIGFSSNQHMFEDFVSKERIFRKKIQN